MSDAHDDTPEAVARGLGELAHLAGARVAALEHLDKQVKAALAELQRVSAGVATTTTVEARVRELDEKVKGRARTRMAVIGLILAVLAGAAVYNRVSLTQTQRAVNHHIDYAAICASKTPGDDAAIRACIASHVEP